jgi:hypothetical protein
VLKDNPRVAERMQCQRVIGWFFSRQALNQISRLDRSGSACKKRGNLKGLGGDREIASPYAATTQAYRGSLSRNR